MAGGIWAYYISFIYPQFAVDPLVTIGMVLMVYLGGRGTVWGPVLGAFILVPAQAGVAEFLQTFHEFPPRQKAASFGVDQVIEKMMDAAGVGHR